jgi:hypothetical protein
MANAPGLAAAKKRANETHRKANRDLDSVRSAKSNAPTEAVDVRQQAPNRRLTQIPEGFPNR